jgi:hypothetical protein
MERVKDVLKVAYIVGSSLAIMAFGYWSFMWVTDWFF